jgi:hypothetical protein
MSHRDEPNQADQLVGIHDADLGNRNVEIKPPEDLDMEVLQVRQNLRLDWDDAVANRRLSWILIIGVVLLYAITLLWGAETGRSSIADKWWAAMGPVCGYLFRGIRRRTSKFN